ncbi:MAG: hypothetical protein ACSW75_00970, partial [Lachnospiraceae bacterium]
SEDWSNLVERDGIRTAYYGLQNGVGEPKTAKVTFVAEEESGQPEELPKVLVQKDGQAFVPWPGEEGITCTEWQPRGSAFVLELTIRPGTENSEMDGVYKFSLQNEGENICHDVSWQTNPEDTLVMDTIRPAVVYAVNQKAKDYPEAGYYKEDFTECFVVTEKNFDEGRMAASIRKSGSPGQTDAAVSEWKLSGREAEMDTYTYRRTHTEEAVYQVEFAGTDLAGNWARFAAGDHLLQRDREAIEAANGADGKQESHLFKSGKKVLDKTPPEVSYTVTALSDTHIYKEGKENVSYFNKDIQVAFTVFEEYFDPDRIDRFYARLDGQMDAGWDGVVWHEGNAVLQKPSGKETEEGGYSYTALVKALAGGKKDGRYTFTIRGTDKAGNGLCVTNASGAKGIDPVQTQAQKKAGIYTTGIKVMDRTSPAAVYNGNCLADKYSYEGDADYFNKDIRVSFVVTEKNFIDDRMSLLANDKRAVILGPESREDSKVVYQGFVAAEKKHHANDGRYVFTIHGTDKAGNSLVVRKGENYTTGNDPVQERRGIYRTGVKVMDTTVPMVTYDASKLDDAHIYAGDADYFNRDLTVTFSVRELNFDASNKRMSLTYRIEEADGNAKAVISGPTAAMNAVHTYTGKVKAMADGSNDGRYVFSFQGEDKAGNKIFVRRGEHTTENDPEQKGSQKELGIYTTGSKVMDTTPPVYTVTEMTEPASGSENVAGLRAYYGGAALGQMLRISFHVDDRNLDEKKIAGDLAYKNGEDYAETDPVWKDPFGGEKPEKASRKKSGFRIYTKSVAIMNGKDGTYRAVIAGEDMAGNRLAMSSEEERRNRSVRAYARTEAYGAEGQYRTMVKVIDTIAPSGNLTIQNAEESVYYSAGLRNPSVLLVRASEPYRNERTAKGKISVDGSRDGHSEHSPVKIEYSVISSVEGRSQEGRKADYARENTAMFSVDEQQVFYLRIALTDRAGNTTGFMETNKIYLDLQDPEIPEDRLAPAIRISANVRTDSHGSLGNPLFNSSVPIHILVTEPNRPRNHSFLGSQSSGLDEVYYTLSVDGREGSPVWLREAGKKRFGEEADGTSAYKEPELVYELEDTRTADRSLNSNNLVLTVYAKDNAGNMRFASFAFGIDIAPPVIRVTFDQNEVRNGRYFKKDRTASVVVTERNFDASKIRITSEGGRASDWVHGSHGGNGDNDTWKKTIVFSEDGDCRFDISGTDLLGNPAESIRIEGAAAKEFTIDKTAPVISLSFDRNDGQEGRYYRKTRKAVIRIVEKNFRSADATVEVLRESRDAGELPKTGESRETAVSGAASQGGWNGSGEVHSLERVFSEDGDYQLLVKAVDLAGNEAKTALSELFTIDTTKPVLAFDGGTARNEAAYGGRFEPGIFYSDTNFSSEGVVFTMAGSKGKVFGEPVHEAEAFGGSSRFPDLERKKSNDDIY